MPKENKRKRLGYVQADVNSALEAIKNGMSLGIACKKFGVPKSTLYTKSKKKVPVEAKMGPSTYLTNEEESKLIEWICFLAERGFPVTKNQLLDSVRQLIIKLERKTSFTNDRPGRHWYEGFLRRHPELATRVAQNLTYTRASVTEKEIRNWFSEVHSHLTKLNLLEIHPSSVFNCDESAFLLCPKPDQVIIRKDSKSVYKVVNADEKESLTTLFMANAAGSIVPPMIMYWYKRMPYNVFSKVPKGWYIGLSDKGWMTAESFYEYISNCFYPWLIKNNTEFPVILYVDGHSSHLTLSVVEFCRKVKIELIALYPNATHILQPLDVAVFHPLKNAWKNAVNNWRLENGCERLRREKFAPLLKKALDSLNLTETIKNGFKACGLLPFSADAVNYNILNKNKKNTQGEQESNATITLNNEQKEYQTHLEFFERNVDNNILQSFKTELLNGSNNIEVQNEGLFLYWIKLKNRSGI